MKNTFTFYNSCLILIAVLFSSNVFCQWEAQISGVTTSLDDVFCINQDTVVVVGDAGVILKTTNGGLLWTPKNSGTLDNIYKVQFPTANIGFAIATHSVNNVNQSSLLKTIDSGENWSPIGAGFTSSINDICFLDEDIIYTSGGGIKKSVDGGATFTTLNSPPSIKKIKFINQQVGFASSNEIIYKTLDGGNIWSIIYQNEYNFPNFEFKDENIGFIYTTNEKFKTIDGGTTLTNMYTPNGRPIDFQVMNENVVWSINRIELLCSCPPSDCISKSNYNPDNTNQLDEICYAGVHSNATIFNAIHFANDLTGFVVGIKVTNPEPWGPNINTYEGIIYKN